MSAGVAFGVILVVGCCLVSGVLSRSHGWSLETPENCPHHNNETNVCSEIVNSTHCIHISWICCGEETASSEHDDYDDTDDYDYDGTHDDNYDGTHGGDDDGDHDHDSSDDDDHPKECANGICGVRISRCTKYKCVERCCDGFERDYQGRCRNETHKIECQNGGTRRWSYGGYFCACRRGFTGKSCEIPMCDCQNNGECTVADGEPRCECLDGYTGTHCEHAHCSPACQNGGSCVSDGYSSVCMCPQGYVGKACEEKYVNSALCPAPLYYDLYEDCSLACGSDADCPDAEVCCNEGTSLRCRLPEPQTCFHGDDEYDVGDTYKKDPCTTCECQVGGRSQCFSMACDMPDCPDGQRPISVPDQCCMSCPPEVETCTYDGQDYSVGDIFKPDPCMKCECTNYGQVECATMKCGYPTCPDGQTPIKKPDQCCMSCPPAQSCTHNGVTYAPDVTFYDECNACKCVDGVAACTKKHCVPDTCTLDDGTVHESGTSWPLACNTCQCDKGVVTCTEIRCACTLACQNNGRCEKNDDKELCRCAAPFYGKVCEKSHENSDRCPAPLLESSEDADDCRVNCETNDECEASSICCMEGCSMVCRTPTEITCHYNNTELFPGDTYNPDPCQSCFCEDTGTMSCYTMDCIPPRCPYGAQPITVQDKCCPVCPEVTCEHNGVTYKEGESFKDDCNTCRCSNGQVSCTEMACVPPVSIRCPTGIVKIDVPAYSSSVELTTKNTKVGTVTVYGRPLMVKFDPPYARHCKCYDSDRAVQWAVASVSNNGVVDKCRVAYVVKDIYPPVLKTCPEDLYVFDDEEITYKRPIYSDNVGIAGERCGMDPHNRTYTEGEYYFKFQIWDFESNTASCTFKLSVSKSDAPFESLPQGLKNRSTDGPSVAMIAAPIAGLLVFAILVAIILLCCRYQRSKNNFNAENAQNSVRDRSREAYDNHIYAVPNDVMIPDYKGLPPNPPAYHSDTISMKSEYASLPPPEYKEVEELRAPVSYLNPDYQSVTSKKESDGSSVA